VLELGAGGALPSIVTAKNGARKVCALLSDGLSCFQVADNAFEGGCNRLP